MKETILNYEDFKKQLFDNISRLISENDNIESSSMNNFFKEGRGYLDAISIKFKNSNLAPCVYVADLYSHYEESEIGVNKLAEEVINFLNHDKPKFNINIEKLLKTPDINEHLYLKLINPDNFNSEEPCTTMNFLNLIAVPRCTVDINGERGSILINKNIQESLLNLSDDELIDIAYNNSRKVNYNVKSMHDILSISGLEDIDDINIFDNEMYILSNTSCVAGAVAIMFPEVLKDIRNTTFNGNNFFIIPSSIHEVILLKDNGIMNVDEMRKMCHDVNINELEKCDILSYDIYYYDGETITIK